MAKWDTMIYNMIKKLLIISATILIIVILWWLSLGWSNYYSIFDVWYYSEKFSCQADDQCVARENNNICINKNYDGWLKHWLKQALINYDIECQCVFHHCIWK